MINKQRKTQKHAYFAPSRGPIRYCYQFSEQNIEIHAIIALVLFCCISTSEAIRTGVCFFGQYSTFVTNQLSLAAANQVKVKVKERIVLREIHLRTTVRHLSMGSHSVMPPDRGDRPAFFPTGQVGTRFIDPVRMKG